jgi:hypothetical protein
MTFLSPKDAFRDRTRKRSQLSLAEGHKAALHGATALLWISGVVWLLYQYGPENHAVQSLCMKIHGAATMLFLMVFGTLFLQHVPLGWKRDRQRPSGVLLVSACAILVITGWALYYAGEETVRRASHWIHIVVGGALPAVIALHVWLGKRTELE